MITLTQEQNNKVKEAIKQFNKWQGKAKIMFDMADNECWTDVFANDNDNEIYQSSTIVCIYSKSNFAGRNEKITFGKLMERIEEIDA
jgi:hypothetical protein